MTKNLSDPAQRDPLGRWQSFESVPAVYRDVVGCRERVELIAWYDEERQKLVLTLTHYDETLTQWQPCWATVATIDAGPFMAHGDTVAFGEMFVDEVHNLLDGRTPPHRD